jgi:hypothetical protein
MARDDEDQAVTPSRQELSNDLRLLAKEIDDLGFEEIASLFNRCAANAAQGGTNSFRLRSDMLWILQLLREGPSTFSDTYFIATDGHVDGQRTRAFQALIARVRRRARRMLSLRDQCMYWWRVTRRRPLVLCR